MNEWYLKHSKIIKHITCQHPEQLQSFLSMFRKLSPNHKIQIQVATDAIEPTPFYKYSECPQEVMNYIEVPVPNRKLDLFREPPATYIVPKADHVKKERSTSTKPTPKTSTNGGGQNNNALRKTKITALEKRGFLIMPERGALYFPR